MPNASNVQIRDASNTVVTVSTLDAVMADGGLVTFGSKADNRSTATDTTPVSAISIWKQISLSIQNLAGLITGGKLPVTASIDATSVNPNGLTTPAASAPVVPADGYSQYETVAASQTNQLIGGAGAVGDYLAGVLVVPATAAAGAVSIKDGAGTAITIFAGGGTTALPTLAPFMVPLGIFSVSGAWQITTGTNVSAIAIGKFT